jgi:hypothetical protein
MKSARVRCAILSGLMLAVPASAQTQRPAAPAAPAAPANAAPAAPALDPAQAASKAAFEQLAEAERRAIQNDLIWTGDFNGVAGGEFGKRTYDAMLAFERRAKLSADGVLAPPERAALRQAADAARASQRFEPVTDAATGIRIGLPAASLTQRIVVENGTVYRRPDGQVSLQLTRLPRAQSLTDLFDQLRQDGPGRKVSYRLQRPDWFVVSGEEGGRKFYTRLAQGPDSIRGYTFRYPATQAAAFDRMMIAIANSFEPFPGTEIAANPSRVAAAPAAAPATPAQRAAAPAPRHAVSGVSLGQGRVLTSAAALASCAEPMIGGRAMEPGAVAASGEIAIITAPWVDQPALRLGLDDGAPVFALSFEEAQARAVMVSPATREAEGGFVTAALQRGAGGAPLLDGQGRLVGIVRDAPKAQRLIAGVAAQASYRVIALGALRSGAALAPAPLPVSAEAGPSARLVSAASASLVEIRCARRT